jgi:hypothetical protein
MGFIKDIGSGLQSNPLSAGLGILGVGAAGVSGRNERHQLAAEEAFQNQFDNSLREGLETGRQRAEQLTGQSYDQTGLDTQDIVKRRREQMEGKSQAAEEIRRRGQTQERRARAAGASDAQTRQISLDAANQAGQVEEASYNQRLDNFQSTISNIMATQSSLEPAYGALSVSSQYIAPEKRNQGILGGIFDTIGL